MVAEEKRLTVYPTNCPDLDPLLQAVIDDTDDVLRRAEALSKQYDRRSGAVGKMWGIVRALREARTAIESECVQAE